MVKKQKLDEEALSRRATARAQTRRESTKIREAYNKEVLELIYNSNDGPDDKTYLKRGKVSANSRAVRATAYVLAERARKVLTSCGINPPLKLDVMYRTQEHRAVSAITDFKSINIQFDMGMVDPGDVAKVADLLAALKGAVYHEGGHILCTLPWSALFDCALMDNGLFPMSVDPIDVRWGDNFAERYPAYVDVRSDLKAIGELIPTDDEKGYNRNSLYYQHKAHYEQLAGYLQPSWNLLEDGRMEEEMVGNNPPMAAYYTSLVLNYVSDEDEPGYSWPFIISRRYLDHEIIDNVRQLAYKFALDKGMDISLVDKIEQQVTIYRQANTATEVVIAIWQMHNLLSDWIKGGTSDKQPPGRSQEPNKGREGRGTPNPSGGSHDGRESGKTEVTEKPVFNDEKKGWENKPGEPKKDSDKPGEGKQPGEGKGGEGDPTEGEGNEKGNESSDAPTKSTTIVGGTQGTGGQIKEGIDYDKLREDLLRKTKEAVERIASKEEAEEVIAEINAELMRDLPHNGSVSAMSGELLADAYVVANQMLAALEPLAVTADPAWRFRQEHGVLDPTSYKMHEPGDSDYWVDYEGEGAHGHSLAVSVMLDTSGSMQGWMDQLSTAAYGIRSACDSLGLPCTVSTFDTEPYLLWDQNENANPVLIHDGGGTNPLDGLRQIKNQNAGKQRHLVVILTDGEWSQVSSIRPFAQPGQYWLLVGLGNANYAKDLVARKGGDVAIGIDNVMDLPKEIEKALVGFLA